MAADSSPLTAADVQLVRDEEDLASAVRELLRSVGVPPAGSDLPEVDAPYVARMRVRLAGRSRDVLLGHRTYVAARRGVRIVDWRTAPLARVFFAHRPGDEFAEEIADRELCGVLESQSLVRFDAGRLVAIVTRDAEFHREADGWVKREATAVPPLTVRVTERHRAQHGAWTGVGDRASDRLGDWMALLDAEQRGVVDDATAAPLVIAGSAGTGKTTAALLRLARWKRTGAGETHPHGALVIVPEPGLARAWRARVDHFDIGGVAVHTYDDWVIAQGRRVFGGSPGKVCTDAPAEVSALKRHPALLAVIPRFVASLAAAMAERVVRRLEHHADRRRRAAAWFASCAGPTLPARLDRLADWLAHEGVASRGAIAEAMAPERECLDDLHAICADLVGDRTWLRAAADVAAGEPGEQHPSERAIDATLAHTRAQLATTTEEAHAHVDAARLHTLDGRAIDDGTAAEYAGSLDVEDFALMFQLLRQLTGTTRTRRGRLRGYHHVVVDEAQELAPVELAVIAAARARGGVLSLAGDPAQQVGEGVRFAGWLDTLDLAGVDHPRVVHLEHTYRCSRTIAEFAHRILGPMAPPEVPAADEDGEPVQISVVAGDVHRAFVLSQALLDLTERSPWARIAVVARTPEGARRLHPILDHSVGARLVTTGDFTFEPGACVTDVVQVKGLEFDVVIIPDASAAVYPDTARARRQLHVAATRARHALWLLAIGKPSPILG